MGGSRCDDPGMEVTAEDLGELLRAAVAAHGRMWESAIRTTDGECRRRSLLPGWSRGHVLTHWARNADGQSRMLRAAMRGEVAAQYPGGDAQRGSDIEAGADRPARLILGDVRAAVDQLEDVWRRMPADAWSQPTAARVGWRPAWMSVWARWRESEIHHVDLAAGYTHRDWPAEFVGLLLARAMPTWPPGWRGRSRCGWRPLTAIRQWPGRRQAPWRVLLSSADPHPLSVLATGPRRRRCGRSGGRPLRAAMATAPPAAMGVTAGVSISDPAVRVGGERRITGRSRNRSGVADAAGRAKGELNGPDRCYEPCDA